MSEPQISKHKEQSPLLIEALARKLRRSTSGMSEVPCVGFPTSVIEGLCVGRVLHGKGGAVLGVG